MKEKEGEIPKETTDLEKERINSLRKLFPESFVENKLILSNLKEALGDIVDSNSERYSFEWAGKTTALKLRYKKSKATLKPYRSESLNFENTNNIFIEGDSLEVLRILQKSYNNQVGIIYIDPPYNINADVDYDDDLRDPLKTYLKYTGQISDDGKKLTTDIEKSGRYHSRWLTKMYPRLYLARNLLCDEGGIIFISIDDFELANLRNIMNEIFGEENFIDTFIVRSNPRGNQAKKNTASEHEYVLCYAIVSV